MDKLPSLLLAIVGTALSGTITAFILVAIYFATFPLARAATLLEPPARISLADAAPCCRPHPVDKASGR